MLGWPGLDGPLPGALGRGTESFQRDTCPVGEGGREQRLAGEPQDRLSLVHSQTHTESPPTLPNMHTHSRHNPWGGMPFPLPASLPESLWTSLLWCL